MAGGARRVPGGRPGSGATGGHASRAIDDLSVREKQILALAGKGLSNSEIADRLHLSTHTIKSHIHNALSKLGASNRAQGASLVLGHVSEAGI